MWKCVLGYGNTHIWLCKNTGTTNRSPTPNGMFVGVLRIVRHVIGSLLAAVGADLSRPHIRKHTRNGKRKYRFDDVKHTCAMTNICVFDNVNTRIW